MFRRLAPLFLIAILLTAFLSACGDEKTPVPSYAGATTVTVPDQLKSSFTSSVKDIKNAQIEAYKTTDSTDKVKGFFTDSFSKGGWTDKTSQFLKPEDAKSFEQLGAFIVGYDKGNKGAVIMGFPGSVSSMMGFSGVSDQETIYMVISGND
jgi:ABC-type uncharacterized transport system auxiliary subunit